jgi:hypothetical protein
VALRSIRRSRRARHADCLLALLDTHHSRDARITPDRGLALTRPPTPVRECPRREANEEEAVQPDAELPEDVRSIREAVRRLARYVQDAAETLDNRIEDEDLDG